MLGVTLGRVENTKNYKMFFLEKEKKYIYISEDIYTWAGDGNSLVKKTS